MRATLWFTRVMVLAQHGGSGDGLGLIQVKLEYADLAILPSVAHGAFLCVEVGRSVGHVCSIDLLRSGPFLPDDLLFPLEVACCSREIVNLILKLVQHCNLERESVASQHSD